MSRMRRMPLPTVSTVASIFSDQSHRKIARRLTAYVDDHYYLKTNPDVRIAGIDPTLHYVKYGWREGRDPRYNVASWNLPHHTLRITGAGEVFANDSPLRFFHFTKLGPLGDAMTERFAGDNIEVYEIWAWYKAAVRAASSVS